MLATTFEKRLPEIAPRLAIITRSFASDEHDAQDLLQNVYEKILTRTKDDATNEEIYRLAGWRCKDQLKRHACYNARVMALHDVAAPAPEDDPDQDPTEVICDPLAASPEADAIRTDELADILAAIRTLPARHQKIVAMLYGGKTQREIARALHVTPQRIGQMVDETRKTLAPMLARKQQIGNSGTPAAPAAQPAYRRLAPIGSSRLTAYAGL